MIKEIVKDVNGNEVTLLRPENRVDVRELQRRRKSGDIADGESLGDRAEDDERDLVDAGILVDE